MTREEAISILKSILADLQRGAKDTDNVSCCLEYGFITYGKAKDCIKALEQESTTKNDLGVDAVSRQAVLNTLDNMDSALNEDRTVETYKELLKECYKVLPSVTPQEPRWIPVSEKLPNDRDWYLGIFKEPDTGWINPLPFICDYVGSETKATTKEYWILRGLTDRGERIDYYFNLECVAWMPLPTPYEPQESENT